MVVELGEDRILCLQIIRRHVLIKSNNEVAYKSRYGISLEESWNRLDEETRMEAVRRVGSYISSGVKINVEYGTDMLLRIVIGYRGSAFLEHAVTDSLPSVRVLIWEPDSSIFLAWCIQEDISAYISDDRYTILFGHNMGMLDKAIKDNLFNHNVNHIAFASTGDHSTDDNIYIDEFKKRLTEKVKEIIIDNNNRKYFGSMPYEDYLYAISILNNNSTIDQLLERIPTRDIPVIIVSAGPSLNKNCKELKKAKGRAIIIAITHSMNTLYTAGIIPDLVAVIDPQDMHFMDFDEDRSYTLLCDVYASRADQKRYNGKIIYFGFSAYEGLFTTDRIRGGINPELGTGSVSSDVFSLFVEAGFDNFIFVGQDLAYDDDGHTHADNFYEEGVCEQAGLDEETEGIYGGKVRTRFDWDWFRKYYEKRIASLTDVRVIDATEGGAFIKGTKVMTLEDAISEYCNTEYPVSEWIEGLEKGNVQEEEEIRQWLDDSVYKCTRVSNMLNEAITINETISRVLENPGLWNKDVSALCGRYDVLYRIILEGNDGDLLRLYCKPEVQYYLEDAMTVEGDENIGKRMNYELKFFTQLSEKAQELIAYISGLNT